MKPSLRSSSSATYWGPDRYWEFRSMADSIPVMADSGTCEAGNQCWRREPLLGVPLCRSFRAAALF